MTPPTPAKKRDREATERTILRAAMTVLATGGFQEFGVNAIARDAGCDKQLIYRYFGGLDGLADAVGAQIAADLADALTALTIAPPPTSYCELMKRLALGFLDLLLGDRIMQQILIWELAAPSPLVKRIIAARGQRLGAWMHALRGELRPPDGLDAPALNAVLIASTQHLVLAAAASGEFAAMPLTDAADWNRVRAAISTLIDGAYKDSPVTTQTRPG